MKQAPTPQKRFFSKDGLTPAERKWRPIVVEWRRSGEPISSFCRGRGLSLPAFKFWKKELLLRNERRAAKRGRSGGSPPRIRMLPVRVLEPSPTTSAPVEIVLRDGRILRVTGDFAPSLLQKVVLTLEEGR